LLLKYIEQTGVRDEGDQRVNRGFCIRGAEEIKSR
jgi:hypothetical protein